MRYEYDKDHIVYLTSRDMDRKAIRMIERNRLRKGSANERAAVRMAESGYGVLDIAEVTKIGMDAARRIVTGE
mgnify:FL=1